MVKIEMMIFCVFINWRQSFVQIWIIRAPLDDINNNPNL